MAKIYANLIRKGLKTIDDVPERLKAEVEAILAEESNAQLYLKMDFQMGGERHGSSIRNTYYQGQKDICTSA